MGNRYTYDANGNVIKIEEANGSGYRVAAAYTYDKLNQLKQETRYSYTGSSNTAASTTVVSYDLDMAGNLYAVTENGSVKLAYTYGDPTWADKLTAVTVNGTTRTIQYADALNPANWYNGTDYTDLTWTQGRRLSGITKGSQTYSYEYDMSGVRSVKIADGLKHEYVTQNGHVVRDTVTNASTGAFQYILDFTYDESGHPLTMRRYKNEAQTSYNTYHYVVNGQGDVVKLLHGTNTTVAEYTYDAYGNVLTKSGSLADLNPLRYRGYYCDTETEFYYLQSRYYDPALRRFLNADSYGSTGQGFLGFNMFAYCNNNPVNGDDPTGHSMDWTREAYSFGTSGAGESCAGGGSGGIGDIIWAIIQILKELTSSQAPACIDALPYTIPSVETKSIPNAEKKDEEKKRNTRTYSVYFLEDENNVIQYVGRVTDDGFTARMWYHKKTKGLELAVKKSGLSYEVARGMEEIGMLACHTLIPGSKGINNRIHGISFKNKEYNSYLDAANEYLKNKAEEDFLNFITFQ